MQHEKRSLRLCLFLVFIWLLADTIAVAQTTQQFTGHVLDSTGALIPAAEVVVHNQGTGVDIRTITTSQGVYTVPYLTPGTYTITATKQGFKTEQKTDILLNVDQTSTIDFHLSVGTTTEQVTVNASASQIELTKSDNGEIFDSDRVSELPLDGRNPYGLFRLAPGTHDFSSSIYPRPFDGVTNSLYANDSPQQPSLSIDGISNDTGGSSYGSDNGEGTNPGIIPSVDAIQEFKVVLGTVDASYGRGGAASIDMALKSGTNQFHGILDYYKRAAWLDAYGWQTKWQAVTNNEAPVKNPHNRNQFSLEFDGPVIIPHLYNGKNKLFFTANYEEMLETLPSTSYSYASIPNSDWLKGDFSTAQYWNATTQNLMPLKIYDPLTPLQTVVDPNDGVSKQAHSQFPGNIVPSNRIDPVGLAILSYLDQVTPNNNPGPGYAPWTDNYVGLEVEKDTWRNALIKVDYALSDADRFSFRWSGQGRWQNQNGATAFPSTAIFNDGGHSFQPKSETGAIQWTHTFNPNLLFDLHATIMSQGNDIQYGPNDGNMLVKLGFASAFYDQVPNKDRFPQVTFDYPGGGAGTTMGTGNLGQSWHMHALDFLPTITWIHGQHTIRAGFDVQLQQASNPHDGYNDTFSFSSNFTNEFHIGGDAPGYASGLSYASGLLGYLNSGGVYYNAHMFEWQPYYAPWVQDDWKITRNLTLNLGFRWDFLVPRVERDNKQLGAFNTTAVNPVTSEMNNGIVIVGGPEFAGVNGQPRSAYAMNWYDWQPRIGFAYAIRPSISIRGFAAKNYLINQTINPQESTGWEASTGYTNSLDGGLTPYTATTGQGLSNPIPVVQQPTGSSLGYLTAIGDGYSFTNPKYHDPSFWNYGMIIEAAVTKHDVISIGYIGNIEPDGPVTDDINHQPASYYTQCDGEIVGWHSPLVTWNSGPNSNAPDHICDDDIAANTIGYEPNPLLGVAAFGASGSPFYSVPLISKADAERPLFGWLTLDEYGANNNYRAWYNSLQLTAKHQVSHDLTLDFNYTRAIDMTSGNFLDTNYRVIARQAGSDGKYSFNLSGVAYLPFGRGRTFFSGVNRWLDEAINGWEVSPLISYHSGTRWRPGGYWEWNTSAPMGIKHTTLPTDSIHNFQRIRGVTPCVGYIDSDTGAVIPSPAATAAGCTNIPYVQAGSFHTPNNIVDFGVTEPGAIKFDAAAAKNFSIPGTGKFLSENTQLQLRIDMLNVLNHASFDGVGYDSTVQDINWGTIPKGPWGVSNVPRYLQLSARLSW